MPRSASAQVRADTLHRNPATGEPVRLIPGLSPQGRAAVARLERTRLWPSAAADALQAWSLFLRGPAHRLFDPKHGCVETMCCPDPLELRAVLAILPPEDARKLRRSVDEIDEQW
ncbi:hypothetical protein [Nonomuraea sediminis]|uniref:hypothetical protein n=1 Tax=Nonomuraea sediminis TaxID=2835864 RepID=UPI001BDD6E52|nr:hypothetical protein [Nonomuraea sediminis]